VKYWAFLWGRNYIFVSKNILENSLLEKTEPRDPVFPIYANIVPIID
jgi:hypothetical protein